jgi:hypothetical protein
VRQLAERLAVKQLAGRWLLPGTLVPLPILGLSLVCVVEAAVSSGSSSSSSSSSQPLLATEATRVTLFLPDDPSVTLSGATAGSSNTGGSAAAATPEDSSSNLAAAVAAARAAAKAAVTGSSQDAAAAAAERAVLAGADAASLGRGGYASLGGTGDYRVTLRELVYLPLQSPELFRRYRIRPPRGVLLHGPPGSGKTVLARAAAADSGARLLVVNGADVMSEYLGEWLFR